MKMESDGGLIKSWKSFFFNLRNNRLLFYKNEKNKTRKPEGFIALAFSLDIVPLENKNGQKKFLYLHFFFFF